jgi:hypothetical protein
MCRAAEYDTVIDSGDDPDTETFPRIDTDQMIAALQNLIDEIAAAAPVMRRMLRVRQALEESV